MSTLVADRRVPAPLPSPVEDDPFLHRLVDRRRDNAAQRRFRRLAPMPVGCVFIPWQGIDEAGIREQFRTMKRLGFTCLKGCCPAPGFRVAQVMHMAVDEGIIPFWYAEGGFEDITPDLLRRLGLPVDMGVDEAVAHPVVRAHQEVIIRRRIDRADTRARMETTASGDVAERRRPKQKPVWMVPSVVGQHRGHELAEDEIDDFLTWLRCTYSTAEEVSQAWNRQRLLDWTADSWSWESIRDYLAGGGDPKEYRHLRDIMRFHADRFAAHIGRAVQQQQAFDPDEPLRAGGEAGLFLPFAARGIDMQAIASAVAENGSFYPSMHLAWHFEEVDFEVARPVYMQASLAADWARGAWSATWESTGGPQYFSGGKAPFVPEVRERFPGFTVDAGTMTQLMLSYLAAGFRGFGLWCWSFREAGWEAGEYALTDRNHRPTARAEAVGAIGRAAVRWRREIWQTHKEPVIGILCDWENDALWAAMAITGRDMYRNVPMRARVGAARACIDANVPFEHVTPADLAAGLGPRYRVLYLPAFICLTAERMEQLTAYVEAGGRVVLDMPGAYYDGFGRIFGTAEGSALERLFGCVLREFGFANPLHTPEGIDGTPCGGFLADLALTTGTVQARYDSSGKPAVVEHRIGRGSAVVIGTQASLDCFRPGNRACQDLLVRHALGAEHRSPYACAECIVYRQAAPGADHWFLINDGPATTARIQAPGYAYAEVRDAVSDEKVDLAAVAVAARSGRWLRAVKNAR